MKLSLEMIRIKLQNSFKISDFATDEERLSLERFHYYTGESSLESGTLYIGKSASLCKNITIEKDASLILIGNPPPVKWKQKICWLSLPEDTDLLSLFNTVADIFSFYNDWEKDLLQLTGSQMKVSDFQRFLDRSSPIFENGLSIMNSDFRIVAEDRVNTEHGGYQVQHVKENQRDIPRALVNNFKFNTDYLGIVEATDIFLYSDDVLPHRCLCKNIFIDHKFIYRIIITECMREFCRTDELLLEYCSQLFLRGIEQMNMFETRTNEALIKNLTGILDTGTVNRSRLKQEAERLSWGIEDRYQVLYVKTSEEDIYLSSLEYQCRDLMRIFRNAVAFPHGTAIICLLHFSENDNGNQDTAQNDSFSVYCRENDFRAGFSNPFNGLYKFLDYYKQSFLALTIGQKDRPHHWIHFFSENNFGYILQKITEDFPAEELVSPIYERLADYDNTQGTEYVRTLQTYLNCNMNVVQTANLLFIHRATMIYRIKRICEIGKTDLKDKSELLHLGLTFTMLPESGVVNRVVTGDGSL